MHENCQAICKLLHAHPSDPRQVRHPDQANGNTSAINRLLPDEQSCIRRKRGRHRSFPSSATNSQSEMVCPYVCGNAAAQCAAEMQWRPSRNKASCSWLGSWRQGVVSDSPTPLSSHDPASRLVNTPLPESRDVLFVGLGGGRVSYM